MEIIFQILKYEFTQNLHIYEYEQRNLYVVTSRYNWR